MSCGLSQRPRISLIDGVTRHPWALYGCPAASRSTRLSLDIDRQSSVDIDSETVKEDSRLSRIMRGSSAAHG